jgi:CHAT domain-containing protein
MRRCWQPSVEPTMRVLPILTLAILMLNLGASPAVSQDSGELKLHKLTWHGAEYELRSDTAPDEYLGQCLEHRWGKVSEPRMQRAFCLKLMLVWGENLFSPSVKTATDLKSPNQSVEGGLGDRLLKRAFELLADDLASRSGADLGLEMAVHTQLRMIVDWGPISIFGEEDALAPVALRYYQEVWTAAPAAPRTFVEFLERFDAGEQLKPLFTHVSPSTPSAIATVLDFYQAAFLFHQRPVPDVDGQGGTVILKAILGFPGLMPLIGYIRVAGEPGLIPGDDVALDDLGRATSLLEWAREKKLLPADEAQSRLQHIEKQKTAFQIERHKWYIDKLEKRGDRDNVAAYRTELRDIYYKMGDTAGSIREQEQLCALLTAVGDREQAAKQAVGLATLRYQEKQWQGVLDALANANEALWESVQFEDLNSALGLEAAAEKELGRPDTTLDWTPKLKAFLADITTTPDMASEGNDSAEQKVANYKKWLAEPGHLETLRTAMKIELGNSLQTLHQYAEAERMTSEVIAEWARQGRKRKEFEGLGALLEIESHGGDVGHFYTTLDRYEIVGSELHGEDWVQTPLGAEIARVLLELGDVHRAESVLSHEMDQERFEALRISRFSKEGKDDAVDDDDMLLQARIDLELGRKEAAEDLVQSLSRGGREKTLELVLGLAQLNAAIGDHEDAIYKCDLLLKDHVTKPLDDLHLWVRISLAKGKSQLALGRDPGPIVTQFGELAPQFTEYKDLDAGQAVEMDIFLADYFSWTKNDAKAVEWLTKGLALADQLGSTDQRIEIHRKLGEAAQRGGDRETAMTEYRQSVSLVNSISTTIPSDLGKVGYRGERNKATALLVVALYNEYRRSGEGRYLAEMWRAVENGKSRALSESVLSGSGSDLNKVSLDEIRAALPPNGELLEYYIPEGAGDIIFRFTADRQGATVKALSIPASQIMTKVTALKAEVEMSADSYDETAFRNHCSELGGVLLPNHWDAFRATEMRQLYIVPAGVLYLFPFALLADEQGKFLDENEHVQVTYLPNATLILRPAPRFADAGHSLAFVNPGRDPEHTEFLESDAVLQQQLETVLRSWSNATMYWERPFTAHELLSEAEKADNVFVYAHGRFIPEDPISSYIRLADEAGSASTLSAADILNAKLGHGLWVLAACSTGSGRVRSGDEVLGLPRAMLQAGASMVVIPLWDVHVSSSWRLMNLFYGNLANGLPVSQALHSAASQLRAEHAVPYDWAPFILVGQHGYRN